jgi:predicted thioesterase
VRAIPPGFEARHEVLVTPSMTVDFEVEDDDRLGALHPVYATYWLAKHMELVSRKIILPHLEDHEEGIGFRVEVDHLASALPGMRVEVTAVFDHQAGNRVHVNCRAVSELGDVVGRGATVQVILAKTRLDENLATLEHRFASHREGRT